MPKLMALVILVSPCGAMAQEAQTTSENVQPHLTLSLTLEFWARPHAAEYRASVPRIL